MIIFDGELVILWRISDLVFLLLAAVLVQNLLFLIFFAGRKILERRMSMCTLRRLTKVIVWYVVIFLPVIVGIVMFKSTYHAIAPPMFEGEECLNKISPTIGKFSFSSWTGYGNHWIFILIFGLWIVGVVVKGVIPYLRERCLMKKLKKTKVEHPDSKLVEMVRSMEREMKLKRPVKILENELLPQPFVTGWIHPQIYLPQITLAEKKWEMMLRHELIHCQRRDSLYRRGLCLLCGFYWFNPFLYWFSHYFVEVSEMACDEEVLQRCSSGERKEYAELLVSFNQEGAFLRQAVALTGYTESGLERRLKNMLKKESKRNRWSIAVIMAIIISVCPLMTVSASYGASVLQDRMVQMVTTEVEEVMNGGNTLTEEVDYIKIEDIDYSKA